MERWRGRGAPHRAGYVGGGRCTNRPIPYLTQSNSSHTTRVARKAQISQRLGWDGVLVDVGDGWFDLGSAVGVVEHDRVVAGDGVSQVATPRSSSGARPTSRETCDESGCAAIARYTAAWLTPKSRRGRACRYANLLYSLRQCGFRLIKRLRSSNCLRRRAARVPLAVWLRIGRVALDPVRSTNHCNCSNAPASLDYA